MVRFLLSLVVVLGIANAASAQVCPKCGRVHSMQLSASSSHYSIALQSATYRAQNGIKGHVLSIERQAGSRVGVGWSTHNPNPATCFWGERSRGQYAVVRGRDGYYSTLILPN